MVSIEDLRGLRCCLYVRVSTSQDTQKQSLQAQIDEGKKRAEEFGMQLIELYIDNGISGTSIENRDGFQSLLNDSNKHKWDVCLFKDESRISRNQLDWFKFTITLGSNDQYIYSILDSKLIDPKNADTSDRLLYSIKSLLAEEFSRNLSKKMKAYNKRRQEQGVLNFTTAPFGWNRVDRNTLVINEEQAECLRYAVQRIISGAGWSVICRELRERGCLFNDKPIFPSSLQRAVLSPRMYGCVVLNKRSKTLGSKKVKDNPENDWIVYEDAIPAIVDKELWLKMKNIYDTRIHNTSKLIHHNKYPLSGKIVCGVCGENYTHKINKRTVEIKDKQTKSYEQTSWHCRSYGRFTGQCNNFIIDEQRLIDIIDKVSTSIFGSLFSDDNRLLNEIMRLLEVSLGDDSEEKRLKQIEDKIASNKKKLEVLLDKLLEIEISNDLFTIKQAELEEKIRSLESERDAIKEKVASKLEKRDRLRVIKEEIIGNKILEKAKAVGYVWLIDKIIVHREDITLEIVYSKERVEQTLFDFNIDSENQCLSSLLVQRVKYDGWISRARKTDNEKRKILAIVKENPTLSYSEISKESGLSIEIVKSRLRTLKWGKYIERGEQGEIRIIKEFNGRG